MMTESASSMLPEWSSFYVMTGSSAAALTGLMFVVITLVMNTERVRRNPEGISTFSTPTVMHFSAALLFSATLCAPWHTLVDATVLIGLVALAGAVYMLRIMYQTRRTREYSADLEDWLWYNIIPFLAYILMLGGAIGLLAFPAKALFVLGGGVVLQLFVGIRNAWDVVTYIAVSGPPPASN
ncbi:MAG TPA: hypothetical protein VFF60_10910 [Candidatus Binatus sp.]|nr:hypothetical protein [Candidatus Binatus sp.]